MKSNKIIAMAASLLVTTGSVLPVHLQAAGNVVESASPFNFSDDAKLIEDSKNARAAFIKSDANMQALFDNAYAYVIFPNVGKGAIGVGGAAGKGIAFRGGQAVGRAKMKQVSIGFQFGGQAYREVIFFENEAEFAKFTQGDYEFAAQASAVAATKGASGNVNYKNGVMIFTQEKKGVMYEASVGGQKFSYEAFKS